MMGFVQRFNTISLEAAETTEATEQELTLFAKIGDMEGLQKAGESEEHIQLEAKLGKQFCRVRKTTKGDDVKYVFTFKVKDADVDQIASSKEYNVEVDKDFFEGFAKVAESKQEKTRYVFDSEKVLLMIDGDENLKSIELPTMHYEIDVFKTPSGEISEWCKIDVELDTALLFVAKNYPELKDVKLKVKVSHLPFKPKDVMQSTTEVSDQRALIDRLYSEEFKTVLNGAG